MTQAARGGPEAEIGDLITLAQELLTLPDLATGPPAASGSGPPTLPTTRST
jgi:hypothetical protein